MVKGPCRGKMCDFWARVRIRKRSVETLVSDIRNSIFECGDGEGISIRTALDSYWKELGVKDMNRLCNEESDLCEKIRVVESQFL